MLTKILSKLQLKCFVVFPSRIGFPPVLFSLCHTCLSEKINRSARFIMKKFCMYYPIHCHGEIKFYNKMFIRLNSWKDSIREESTSHKSTKKDISDNEKLEILNCFMSTDLFPTVFNIWTPESKEYVYLCVPKE